MRIIYVGLIGVLLLILSGCSLSHYRINRQLENGNYLGVISLLADDMDKQSLPLSEGDAKYLLQTVDHLTEAVETDLTNKEASDFYSRVESYKLLLTIRKQLADKPYGEILTTFNQRYPEKVINQHLAAQYYDYAKSQRPTTSDDYKKVAEIYKEGMAYDRNYKDIAKQYKNSQNQSYRVAAQELYAAGKAFALQKKYKEASESFAAADAAYKPLGHYKDSVALSKQYDKKYRTITAEKHYTAGKNHALQENYKDAAESFTAAEDIYRPIGHYKDSAELAKQYDKKYRTIAAENNFTQAQLLGQQRRYKSTYRSIAYYYQAAADIYQPYGDYKGAASLAAKNRDLGQVYVYIANSEFSHIIENALSASYISFVSYSAADVVIDISLDRPDYSHDYGTEQTENRYEKINAGEKAITNADGSVTFETQYQEYSYTLHSRKESNSIKLYATVSASGSLSSRGTASGSASSEATHYWVTGNVPPSSNYNNSYTSGKLLSERELYEIAYKDIESALKTDLISIESSLSSL
ncbi:hypothetical protein PT276_04845 [Orbaceae bacterium ESL0721]|nr:hypothetical protein [Orbaceae bacterium ESL0721]